MTDIIVILVILAIIGAAVVKIRIEKKKGSKCMGCPYGESKKKDCGCNHDK